MKRIYAWIFFALISYFIYTTCSNKDIACAYNSLTHGSRQEKAKALDFLFEHRTKDINEIVIVMPQLRGYQYLGTFFSCYDEWLSSFLTDGYFFYADFSTTENNSKMIFIDIDKTNRPPPIIESQLRAQRRASHASSSLNPDE